MKSISVKALLSVVVLAVGALVHADVIVDNLNQPTANYFGPIGDDSNSNDFLVGQEITLPAGANPYQLNEITLLLSATGGGANITVSVWSVDSDNNPSSEIAMVSSQFVANAGNVDFVPTNNITLPPGIYYVVAAPTTPADSGRVSWAYTGSTNWTGSGILDNYADTYPGNWLNFSITNSPEQLSVAATPMTATVAITGSHGNTVLSWTTNLFGYVLDTTTNLSLPAWQPTTNLPTAIFGFNTFSNSFPGAMRFFRLRQNYVVENVEQPQTDWDGPIGTDNNHNDFLLAQEFTLPAGNYNVNKATLSLIPVNGNGSVTVSLWNVDRDNNPTNEIAVVASQFVSSAGDVDFVPSAPIALPAGMYYVMAAPKTSADNAKIGWYWTSSTSWTGFGALGDYAGTRQGFWGTEPISDGPYQMGVQATPINGF